MDETQLLERIRAGDTAAERALYDAHVDRIYRLAYRMTGDEALAQDFTQVAFIQPVEDPNEGVLREALAQDFTQDAFIRVFDRLDSFRGDSSLSTWMHMVTTSVVLNGLRKVKKFRTSEIDLDRAGTVAGREHRAEPDLRDRLRRAIDGLPDGYRTVFVMHDIEGYTHEEIAGALGVATGTSSRCRGSTICRPMSSCLMTSSAVTPARQGAGCRVPR